MKRRVVEWIVWVLVLLAALALTLGLLRVAVPEQPYEPDPNWEPSQSGGRARVAEGAS